MASLQERFQACIVLTAAGDAIGYKNGEWEFNKSGPAIHREVERLGGLDKLNVSRMRISDDTIMHNATCKALIRFTSREVPQVASLAEIEAEAKRDSESGSENTQSFHHLMKLMAEEYIRCWPLMPGRAPGPTCSRGVSFLKLHTTNHWYKLAYSARGGGCGGSMRAMAIGLRFSGEEYRDVLIACSIESGRLTHNHPTGFLGAMVSGAFTALAIEDIPVKRWGKILMDELIPKALGYCEMNGRDWPAIQKDSHVFIDKWNKYLELRNIRDGESEPVFPANWDTDIEARDAYYSSISYNGWGGASGDDSVIIAYDALLGAGNDWCELLKRGALHGGDSDSTAAIAGAWWGAIYGFQNVPQSHYASIEFKDEHYQLANELFALRPQKQQEQQN